MAKTKTPAQKPESNGHTEANGDSAPAFSPKKTKCPVSRKEFAAKAKPLSIRVGEQLMAAQPKEFSTGSFGWFCQGSVTVEVDGVPCKIQVGMNLIVANSKDAE